MRTQDELEAWLNIVLLVWSIGIVYVNLFSGPWIADDPEERTR